MKEPVTTVRYADVLACGCEDPIVIVFWRDNCPPCERLKPKLRELLWSDDYAGVILVELNIVDEMDAVRTLGLRAAPSVVVSVRGEAKIAWTGDISREQMAQILASYGAGTGAL